MSAGPRVPTGDGPGGVDVDYAAERLQEIAERLQGYQEFAQRKTHGDGRCGDKAEQQSKIIQAGVAAAREERQIWTDLMDRWASKKIEELDRG